MASIAMPYAADAEVYTAAELALASGVPIAIVETAIRSGNLRVIPGTSYIAGPEAVRVGRMLTQAQATGSVPLAPAPSRYAVGSNISPRQRAMVSTAAIHGVLLGVAVWFSSTDARTAAVRDTAPPTRLVFLVTPGPGGGGGGGGTRSPRQSPRLERRGDEAPAASVPEVAPDPVPAPIAPAEPLPSETIVAPVAAAATDASDADTGVPGRGMGDGLGAGVGEGAGGGTGGGPFRPGSGIDPPRLLREVKATYTDEARRQNVRGAVDLEIVVQSDGSVGAITVLRGLGAGLDQRAIDAVRQWRFAPATRFGRPVDVIVEVGIEFNLR